MFRLLSKLFPKRAAAGSSSGGWANTQWNESVNLQSLAAGFSFQFPGSNGHVNSIQRKQGSIPLRKTITFTCRIKTLSGLPKFISLDMSPAPPALKPNCRVLLQRRGDDWSGAGDMANYRWWSSGAQCVFLLADGIERVYAVKLIPANWTNVWGKYNPSAFKACLANLDNVQIVFGGGNSFSHGIWVDNGSATFELLRFGID